MPLVVCALSSCAAANNPPTEPSHVDRVENSRDDIDMLDTKRKKAKDEYDNTKKKLKAEELTQDSFVIKSLESNLKIIKSRLEKLDKQYMAACVKKYGNGNACHTIIESSNKIDIPSW